MHSGFLTGAGLGAGGILSLPPILNFDFISTWDTRETSTGSTNSDQLRFPLTSGGSYNFVVDWGDGSSDTITAWDQAEATHTYTTEGIYETTCSGLFEGFRFNNTGDKEKLLSVISFGSLKLLEGITNFWGCRNMTSWGDVPDISSTTSLASFLRDCTLFNSDIQGLASGNVNNTANMLRGSSTFNQPLGDLDTRSVTIINNMLNGATNFNNRFDFDVSAVANASGFATGTGISAGFYDQALNYWNTLSLQSNVALAMGSTNYTAAGAAARANIISTFGWNISDGGQI